MDEKKLTDAEIQPLSLLTSFPTVNESKIDVLLNGLLKKLNRKIVVLDDDPTGSQTVHDISVYTDWKPETVLKGFEEKNNMFFLMTNSRGLVTGQTIKAHKEIATAIVAAAKKTGRDFLIVSRSDSTLRGHYPIETTILKEEIEKLTDKHFDGEIILPFFKEGGRFTINNIHYVKEDDHLTPTGMTEFAKDKSFSYTASHLGKWCEEKNAGKYNAEQMEYISLDTLRSLRYNEVIRQLEKIRDFNKVIVNAVDYVDVKIFCIALVESLCNGKEFIIRSAAAVAKVLGGISNQPLLTKKQLITSENTNGGIVIIGSHVNKTTRQLKELKNCIYPIEFIEFDQHLVIAPQGLTPEVKRVVKLVNNSIRGGRSVVVYTRRERIDLETDDKDQQLEISLQISNSVTSIVSQLSVRPNFIIAKGGITSSDIGTKALGIKRALVMGQIKPGIPVWMTGDESRFPHMPYIIFPGNIGEDSTLREVLEILMEH